MTCLTQDWNDDRYNNTARRGQRNCQRFIPFEQAYALARFYYDFQDTNALIADAEVMAGVIPVTFLKAASSSTIFSRYSERLSDRKRHLMP